MNEKKKCCHNCRHFVVLNDWLGENAYCEKYFWYFDYDDSEYENSCEDYNPEDREVYLKRIKKEKWDKFISKLKAKRANL